MSDPTERELPSERCDTRGDDEHGEPWLLMLPSLQGHLDLQAALDTQGSLPIASRCLNGPWGGLSGAPHAPIPHPSRTSVALFENSVFADILS